MAKRWLLAGVSAEWWCSNGPDRRLPACPSGPLLCACCVHVCLCACFHCQICPPPPPDCKQTGEAVTTTAPWQPALADRLVAFVPICTYRVIERRMFSWRLLWLSACRALVVAFMSQAQSRNQIFISEGGRGGFSVPLLPFFPSLSLLSLSFLFAPLRSVKSS